MVTIETPSFFHVPHAPGDHNQVETVDGFAPFLAVSLRLTGMLHY